MEASSVDVQAACVCERGGLHGAVVHVPRKIAVQVEGVSGLTAAYESSFNAHVAGHHTDNGVASDVLSRVVRVSCCWSCVCGEEGEGVACCAQ